MLAYPRYIVQHYEQGYLFFVCFIYNLLGLKEGSWCALEYDHISQIAGDRLVVTQCSPQEYKFFPHKGVVFHEQNITQLDMGCSKDDICLFDMRAEIEVSPADAQQFKYFLFGGILGDSYFFQ